MRSLLKQISFLDGKDSNWGIVYAEFSKLCNHSHDAGFMCLMDMCQIIGKKRTSVNILIDLNYA